MTTDHTAQDLLAAVGVDWKQRYAFIVCPECQMTMAYKGIPQHGLDCRRPSTRDVEPTYTGPALGTPELDAILLVAGFKWMCKNGRHEAHVHLHDELPGHALARAIREVGR